VAVFGVRLQDRLLRVVKTVVSPPNHQAVEDLTRDWGLTTEADD